MRKVVTLGTRMRDYQKNGANLDFGVTTIQEEEKLKTSLLNPKAVEVFRSFWQNDGVEKSMPA